MTAIDGNYAELGGSGGWLGPLVGPDSPTRGGVSRFGLAKDTAARLPSQ